MSIVCSVEPYLHCWIPFCANHRCLGGWVLAVSGPAVSTPKAKLCTPSLSGHVEYFYDSHCLNIISVCSVQLDLSLLRWYRTQSWCAVTHCNQIGSLSSFGIWVVALVYCTLHLTLGNKKNIYNNNIYLGSRMGLLTLKPWAMRFFYLPLN